eukprot:TRINITY_DN91049_c0_g1_i1.p1 TRINITY_DN91049_c0_g1~~TRINITY_DN91049_c0_g1_i1.p1  ORF type:complete len:193 (+),score=45.70 TRINITY_DN91049_c0_g1_i1:67-579(+)
MARNSRSFLATFLAVCGAYAALCQFVGSVFVGAPLRQPRHVKTARSFFFGGDDSSSSSSKGSGKATVEGVKTLMGDKAFMELRKHVIEKEASANVRNVEWLMGQRVKGVGTDREGNVNKDELKAALLEKLGFEWVDEVDNGEDPKQAQLRKDLLRSAMQQGGGGIMGDYY